MFARGNLSLLFILFTVALDAIGIGLIFPVMPDLMEDVTHAGLGEAALWGGVLAASFAVMQFLCGPLVGNLSDRFGRRPVLLVSLAVMALDYVVMALAHTVWLLLAARIVAGVAAATHATANAYVADISTPDQRAKRFGLIGAALWHWFCGGADAGRVLAGIDVRAPFWVAAGLALANLVFGWFVMPESLAVWRTGAALHWARANPLASLRAIRRLPGLQRLLLVTFLYAVTFNVWPAIWSYYGKAAFGWNAQWIGLALAAFGVCMALTQALLVAPMIRRLGRAAHGGGGHGAGGGVLWVLRAGDLGVLGAGVHADCGFGRGDGAEFAGDDVARGAGKSAGRVAGGEFIAERFGDDCLAFGDDVGV